MSSRGGFLEGLIVGALLGGLSILVASPSSRQEISSKVKKIRDENEEVFESTEDLIAKTIPPCKTALKDAVITSDEIDDPNNLSLRTLLNGNVMQEWNTNDMIFDVPTLIEFLSASTILNPGTVILTGTPHGVGFARTPPVYLQPGDEVTVEIEGVGRLTNPVIENAIIHLQGVE